MLKLRVCDLAVGIDKRLLIESAHTFERADIKRVLRAKTTRVSRFNLATSFVILLFPL